VWLRSAFAVPTNPSFTHVSRERRATGSNDRQFKDHLQLLCGQFLATMHQYLLTRPDLTISLHELSNPLPNQRALPRVCAPPYHPTPGNKSRTYSDLHKHLTPVQRDVLHRPPINNAQTGVYSVDGMPSIYTELRSTRPRLQPAAKACLLSPEAHTFREVTAAANAFACILVRDACEAAAERGCDRVNYCLDDRRRFVPMTKAHTAIKRQTKVCVHVCL